MTADDSTKAPSLGIVVPTLNEAEHLPALLRDLAELPVPHRVVIADGGSSDETRDLARRAGATVIVARRGRAHQMNAGARVVGSPWLLFLHADCLLPAPAREVLAHRLAAGDDHRPAYFRFSLNGTGWFWRFIEFGQSLRERLTGLAYGDQGLLVRGSDFDAVGGFPAIPILEDVALLRALRSRSRIERLPACLPTSPRRFQEEGRWRSWIRNTSLISLAFAGVDPKRLAPLYPIRGSHPPSGRLALVFAKAPTPGRVKTRLAAGIGDEAAAQVYSEMASRLVRCLVSPAYDLLVCYDPPEEAEQVREWLGDEVALMPQDEGDLGQRMFGALGTALGLATEACVVGTDAPDLSAAILEEAFDRLSEADLVIGPAEDGGYYLLGLKHPWPELFQDIPWSTPRVLDRTLEAARGLGLKVHTLVTLADVDTVEDLLRR